MKIRLGLLPSCSSPPPPPPPENPEHFEYPELLPDPPQISLDQIHRQIAKLSPYKAHGPDGIPNVLLQRCINIIIDRLTTIFRAIMHLNIYYDPWKEFTSLVIRKPGKMCYEVPNVMTSI